MHRITITREQFKDAINAGLVGAPNLPEDVKRKLVTLSIRAKTVSGNFHGCPLTRVVGYDRAIKSDGVPDGFKFITAYDLYLIQETDAWKQYIDHGWQVVTNKHGEEIIFIKD